MRNVLYILLLLLIACQSHKPIIAEGNKQHLEKHQIDKQVLGKVINRPGPVSCQWIIKLKDGREMMPVKWPLNAKKHHQKIQFTFRQSRAPQPPCFNGKMIVIENYILLKK